MWLYVIPLLAFCFEVEAEVIGIANAKRQSLAGLLDQVKQDFVISWCAEQFLKTRKRERSRSEESFEKQSGDREALCSLWWPLHCRKLAVLG